MMNLQGTRITWLGHATVLIQTARGTNLLIDPFIAQNPKYPGRLQNNRRVDRGGSDAVCRAFCHVFSMPTSPEPAQGLWFSN